MKKFLFVFGLVGFILLASSVNAPRVLAQGPAKMSPQQIVDAYLSKGAKVTSKSIVGPTDFPESYRGMCSVIVSFDLKALGVNPPFTGQALTLAAEEIGLSVVELTEWARASVLHNPDMFTITMYFPPDFCNPPSGDVKAQNPVPVTDRAPHPSHNDPGFMILVVAVVALGFLFFPRFVGAIVPV